MDMGIEQHARDGLLRLDHELLPQVTRGNVQPRNKLSDAVDAAHTEVYHCVLARSLATASKGAT